MFKVKGKHDPGCTDQTRFDVIREYQTIEDAQGNVLDADPDMKGEIVSVRCAECGAECECT